MSKQIFINILLALITVSGKSQTIPADWFKTDTITIRGRIEGYYPVSTMSKDAYVYTQHIGISLSYNFNVTRSKYKGTGAGNAEKNRL